MSIEELVRAATSLDDNSSDCAERAPIFRELASRRPDLTDIANEARLFEIWCALDRRDGEGAFQKLLEMEANGRTMNAAFGLYLAALADDGPEILARAKRTLLEGDAQSYARLDPELYYIARRNAFELDIEDGLFAIEAEAASGDSFEDFSPMLQQTLLKGSFEHARNTGNLAAIPQVLGRIDDPPFFVSKLVEREYEALWPALERRVGPGFASVVPEYRDAALARYNSSPDNLDFLNEVSHALYYAGDYAQLIALVDEATKRPDFAATMQEDEAWALNLKAYSLDALGREAEADEVFDFLAEHSDRDAGWAVSFVINRASRLVAQQRWEEGLAAARLAKDVAEQNGNEYANMLVARDHTCALNALGRADEAAEHIRFLIDGKEDDPGLAAVGMLCLGREDDAAALVVEALRGDAHRELMIERLQPEETELFYTRSALPELSDLLTSHPQVRVEFDKHARIMPEEYFPAAAARRMRR